MRQESGTERQWPNQLMNGLRTSSTFSSVIDPDVKNLSQISAMSAGLPRVGEACRRVTASLEVNTR